MPALHPTLLNLLNIFINSLHHLHLKLLPLWLGLPVSVPLYLLLKFNNVPPLPAPLFHLFWGNSLLFM